VVAEGGEGKGELAPNYLLVGKSFKNLNLGLEMPHFVEI